MSSRQQTLDSLHICSRTGAPRHRRAGRRTTARAASTSHCGVPTMTSDDAGHWLRTKGHATYVADAHPESERWATWACCWVAGDAVPLEVDLSRVSWRTVTDRAEIDGAIGRTQYRWGGECTVWIYSGLGG